MNRTTIQFLELLRVGLWGQKPQISLFSEETDWAAIMHLAKDQTVLLLIADAYSALPVEFQPPKSIQFSVEANRIKTSQMHLLLNKTLVDVTKLMADHGIRCILFKGQGLASNYIKPQSRSCGDIDLYVGEAQLEQAYKLLSEFGEIQGEDKESEKHIHCKRNGVDIEIHRIAESLDLPWQNSRYQSWTQKYLLEGNEFEQLTLGENKINLPPAQFNIIYVFNHFYHHFLTGGVGLRQLCDWARLLHTYYGKYNVAELEKDLKAFGLILPWRIFGQLAVDYLGLPTTEMPLYKKTAGKRVKKALDSILFFGNFGRNELALRGPRPKGYYSGKLYSFRHQMRNNLRLFFIFPLTTAIHTLAYTINGTIVALKRK